MYLHFIVMTRKVTRTLRNPAYQVTTKMINIRSTSLLIFVALASEPLLAQALPSCRSIISDTDGDGYGWENGATCIVTAGNSTGGNTGGSNTGGNTTSDFRAIGPSGTLGTGTPVFEWHPLDGAEMYTVAISDSNGNGYSYQIDPLRAGCQSGGTCSAKPDLGYYDNDLT